MPSANPAVSIGLPVYNGARHLRSALDSLLAQDHGNFELIISDNASTDATAAICLEYARTDGRIHYSRNPTNLGSARNFNRVFRLSSGNYFMWAAHDDLWNPSYVRKCLKALEDDTELVLCGTDIAFIDDNGDTINSVEYHGGDFNELDTHSMGLRQRVKVLTMRRGWYAFYGLIRADALRKTHLYSEAFGGDVILLMELLLLGPTLILREKLFSYRLVPKSTETYLKDITATIPATDFKPYTELAKSLLRVIGDSRCPESIKADMRSDLLDNVCKNNESWSRDIVGENPAVMHAPNHLRHVECRKMVMPEISPTELEKLRRDANEQLLSRMPLPRRVICRLRRMLDRHILWRLRRVSR